MLFTLIYITIYVVITFFTELNVLIVKLLRFTVFDKNIVIYNTYMPLVVLSSMCKKLCRYNCNRYDEEEAKKARDAQEVCRII